MLCCRRPPDIVTRAGKREIVKRAYLLRTGLYVENVQNLAHKIARAT